MVGGLADWFAVTALFRHPLGLPIPHTAIIPTRKDALGRNLSDFVGTNFLSEQVVRERLRNAEVPRRLGRWLAEPEHAARVTAELARALRGAVDVLRDEDVRAVLEPVVLRRLAALPVGPTLGRLLAQVVADKAHHRLVDLVAAAVDDWLAAQPGAGDRPRRPAGAAVVAGVRRPGGRRPDLRRAGPGLGRGQGPAGARDPAGARPAAGPLRRRPEQRPGHDRAGVRGAGEPAGPARGAARVRGRDLGRAPAAAGDGRRPGRRAAGPAHAARWPTSAAGWTPTTRCAPGSTRSSPTRPATWSPTTGTS